MRSQELHEARERGRATALSNAAELEEKISRQAVAQLIAFAAKGDVTGLERVLKAGVSKRSWFSLLFILGGRAEQLCVGVILIGARRLKLA